MRKLPTQLSWKPKGGYASKPEKARVLSFPASDSIPFPRDTLESISYQNKDTLLAVSIRKTSLLQLELFETQTEAKDFPQLCCVCNSLIMFFLLGSRIFSFIWQMPRHLLFEIVIFRRHGFPQHDDSNTARREPDDQHTEHLTLEWRNPAPTAATAGVRSYSLV